MLLALSLAGEQGRSHWCNRVLTVQEVERKSSLCVTVGRLDGMCCFRVVAGLWSCDLVVFVCSVSSCC